MNGDFLKPQWLPFAADPFVHADLNLKRDKLVCQIGSPYPPRPLHWDIIRHLLDGGEMVRVPDHDYRSRVVESPSTFFGRATTLQQAAEVYSRSQFTISSSNVDFVPMRSPEAFALGTVLLSDDVPSMREAFGAPYPGNLDGIWVAHDRTPDGIVYAMQSLKQEEIEGIRTRAKLAVYREHLYYHKAKRILEAHGLAGACRTVAE